MINHTTRLRWRRRFRKQKKQVEVIGIQADQQLDRHFFRRINRLGDVRRFVIVWVMLLILIAGNLLIQIKQLGNYYLFSQAVPGGTYTEGILGTFTNANPIYANTETDLSVSRLVFAGLLTYSPDNKLVNNLAQSWQVDERGTKYTVTLRPNIKWHDGVPMTADDVVFTYKTIQNADAQSPLFNSWRDIKIAKQDSTTITFTLPNTLSSFPQSMTNGIIPKHIIDKIPVTQLRSSAFNTSNPVGTGPFKWHAIEVRGNSQDNREERIELIGNDNYYSGAPKLDRFIVRSFHSKDQLLESFKKQELNGVNGLQSLPKDFKGPTNIGEYRIPLTGEVMVFLKNSHPILQDLKVRQALLLSTNVQNIRNNLNYPTLPASQPLLRSNLGYDKKYSQATTNVVQAKQLLDASGWVVGPDGIRVKNGMPLTFDLYSQENSEFSIVAKTIQQQWRAVGVGVGLILQPANELQGVISQHTYDALLYGISIGTDPDVFVYWHSSQADIRSATRLNFSEYKSAIADKALEAGRTRSDPSLRAIKYAPFLQAWQGDVPAIALYQPRFYYVTDGQLHGLGEQSINVPQDRFNNVVNWTIRQKKIAK